MTFRKSKDKKSSISPTKKTKRPLKMNTLWLSTIWGNSTKRKESKDFTLLSEVSIWQLEEDKHLGFWGQTVQVKPLWSQWSQECTSLTMVMLGLEVTTFSQTFKKLNWKWASVLNSIWSGLSFQLNNICTFMLVLREFLKKESRNKSKSRWKKSNCKNSLILLPVNFLEVCEEDFRLQSVW
jgi:hypothetical protein